MICIVVVRLRTFRVPRVTRDRVGVLLREALAILVHQLTRTDDCTCGCAHTKLCVHPCAATIVAITVI